MSVCFGHLNRCGWGVHPKIHTSTSDCSRSREHVWSYRVPSMYTSIISGTSCTFISILNFCVQWWRVVRWLFYFAPCNYTWRILMHICHSMEHHVMNLNIHHHGKNDSYFLKSHWTLQNSAFCSNIGSRWNYCVSELQCYITTVYL